MQDPQKEAIHDQIIEKIIDKSSSDYPFAVFIGGGAASGKSAIRDNIIIPWLGDSAVIIDADIIKNWLDHQQLPGIDEEKTSIQIHKESKHIAHKAINLCLENKIPFIYDSSLAAPPQEYLPFIHLAKQKRFYLIIIGVHASEDIALAREKERSKKINRKVPTRILHYFHDHFPATFVSIEKEFDLMRIYDNSINGALPSLVAERDSSGLHIVNQEKFREFIQKT
ncbi:MAG: zeta toxin family protein [Dehalobacterium sp.]